MLNEYEELIQEVDRLISAPESQREEEGVYANTSQLRFLMKKIKSSGGQKSSLVGIEKFVADISSSDGRLLRKLDDFMSS